MGKHSSRLDAYIGTRVCLRRTEIGMSDNNFAARLGLTLRQVQNYEGGDLRIAASLLYKMAGILGVPVSYFFEGFNKVHNGLIDTRKGVDLLEQLLTDIDLFALVETYIGLDDPLHRRKLVDFARTLR